MATLLLIIIYIAFISLGLPDSLLGVAWPEMQPEFAIPASYAGFVSITGSSGTILSSLLSGRFLKRFGTGKVTFVSVLLTAVALFGFSQAPSFIWLIILAIPLGLGAGSVDAGLNDYVAKHYKAHHMSWLHCFWGIGAMTGPLIISQFISNGDSWRYGYLTISILQFALVAVLLLSIPLWNKVSVRPQLAETPTAETPQEPNPFTEHKGILAPLKVDGVKSVLLVFLFYCGIEATVGLWSSSFLIASKGLDAATAAVWVSAFYGSITLGRFINGFITMRYSSKDIIRFGEISILIGVLLLFLPLPNIFVLFGLILIGLGCAPIFPSMLHETPARFGNEAAQNIMGFQMAVAYTGTTILPPLFGFIATNINMNLFPIFLLVYIIIMLISSEQVNAFMRRKIART